MQNVENKGKLQVKQDNAYANISVNPNFDFSGKYLVRKDGFWVRCNIHKQTEPAMYNFAKINLNFHCHSPDSTSTEPQHNSTELGLT